MSARPRRFFDTTRSSGRVVVVQCKLATEQLLESRPRNEEPATETHDGELAATCALVGDTPTDTEDARGLLDRQRLPVSIHASTSLGR